MPREEQLSLFSPDLESPPLKPPGDQLERMRVLITVKAAPTPSETYGETAASRVCASTLTVKVGSGYIRSTFGHSNPRTSLTSTMWCLCSRNHRDSTTSVRKAGVLA